MGGRGYYRCAASNSSFAIGLVRLDFYSALLPLQSSLRVNMTRLDVGARFGTHALAAAAVAFRLQPHEAEAKELND